VVSKTEAKFRTLSPVKIRGGWVRCLSEKNVVCPGIGLHLKSGRYADSRVRIRKERKKMKFASKAYKPSDGQIRLALIYLSVAQIHTISRNEA